MKKTASKVAKRAQIQPKSQFLFHKNLPPRDFSIMTLVMNNEIGTYLQPFSFFISSLQGNFLILNSDQDTMERNSCLFWTMLNVSLFLSNIGVFILSLVVHDYGKQPWVIGGYLPNRCLNGVNQSGCFYFRISWIFMERHWFYFFCPRHLVQGFRSLEHRLLQKFSVKNFDQKFRFFIKK